MLTLPLLLTITIVFIVLLIINNAIWYTYEVWFKNNRYFNFFFSKSTYLFVSDIIHLCQRFSQSWKHFWNELFGIISEIVAKRVPFIGAFSFGRRNKSTTAKSVKYGGWGMITVLIDRCVSWCVYLFNRSKTLSFQCHSHAPMIHHQLWPFPSNLDRRWTSSASPEQWPSDIVFAQNLAILEQSSLPHVSCPKHPLKLLGMSQTV